jgi:hypothetical protein
MKKILLTLFFAAGIFVLWSHGEMVWSNRRFLDEPRVHKIEKGEYLSRLAQQYYGDPQRWRELALINRAPIRTTSKSARRFLFRLPTWLQRLAARGP